MHEGGRSGLCAQEHIGRIGSAVQIALEKKQAELKLRQSEELFRLITDNVTDLIAILDLQGKRLYNSTSYREILGDPQSLRGTSSFKEIHPDDVAKIKQVFEETVRTGTGKRANTAFCSTTGPFVTSNRKAASSATGRESWTRCWWFRAT